MALKRRFIFALISTIMSILHSSIPHSTSIPKIDVNQLQPNIETIRHLYKNATKDQCPIFPPLNAEMQAVRDPAMHSKVHRRIPIKPRL